ncbi:DUF1214 domain-containing protein [Variovorax sp. J22R24]|uniref:DUF1214 domain-containing protein n=1 Tax=Variovorax gracilis TaxID=3053502 RepID=UPI002578C78C|nr:DUF1214 domain-containing protein [Variovorax sp. J22R24]MDM0109866.1 DUF1214 domain-containing protein [Variovorax sp. J22R24]
MRADRGITANWYVERLTALFRTSCAREGRFYRSSTHAQRRSDPKGRHLDGGKTYKVTLPGPVPDARFWSFTVYDNQTPLAARN